jgi:hypothetical protein
VARRRHRRSRLLAVVVLAAPAAALALHAVSAPVAAILALVLLGVALLLTRTQVARLTLHAVLPIRRFDPLALSGSRSATRTSARPRSPAATVRTRRSGMSGAAAQRLPVRRASATR